MGNAIFAGIHVTTLVVLLGSLGYRIYVMQRNTTLWNGLGRALRAENIVYLLLWLWVLLRIPFPVLDHDGIRVVIALVLIVITIRVTYLLPHVEIRHPRRSSFSDEVAETIDQTAGDVSEMKGDVAEAKADLKELRQRMDGS